jgi:predicted porin
MIARRVIAGVAAGALLATGALVAPAFGAMERPAPRTAKRTLTRAIGGFTPAAGDPRLAALFARSGLGAEGFRFTPAETRAGNRGVAVAVRARTNRDADRVALASTPATIGITPIAYSLGAAVAFKRVAITGDVVRLDLAGQPGERETANVAVTYDLARLQGRVRASADRPLAGTPRAIAEKPSYLLDVGGSYALTRNLDLTAGLRYRSERDRLTRVDQRRDDQAVYVGTAFRF